MSNDKYPPYVWMIKPGYKSALRWDNATKEYWKDAGAWGVGAKFLPDGSMKSVSFMNSLSGNDLIPCTKVEWAGNNRGYT